MSRNKIQNNKVLTKKRLFNLREEVCEESPHFEPGQAIFRKMNEKRARLDNKQISYRTINHWEKSGLISNTRPSGKGWRKYSIIDLVWIQVIVELRDFGFPINKIMKVKENLDHNDFVFYTVIASVFRMPVFLLVFHNCDIEPAVGAEYKLTQEYFKLSTHIIINLNDILQRIFPHKDMSPKFEKTLEVSPEELDLLFMIRMENYESITIKTTAGKIEQLEASKSEKTDSRVVDLIQSGDYQDIEIKQRDQKIVYIKRIIKKRYKKNGKQP